MHPISREFSNSINTLNLQLQNQNQNQNPVINNSIHSQMHFDHNNEFLEQILPSSFPWSTHHLQDHSSSKLSQHQMINNGNFMQQLLVSRGFGSSVLPDNHKHIIDGYSFNSTANLQAIDAPVKALYNGFAGSVGQTSNQPHQFHNPTKVGPLPAMKPPAASGVGGMKPPAASGPSVGGMKSPAASGPSMGGIQRPRQRVRARRGQATDPHSVAERLRRERIAERMKGLQELVPSANKTDKASMLDDIIDYVKFLRLQVKVLSMSRIGGAAAIAPLVPDFSSEGTSADNGTRPPSSPNNNDGITVTEQHILKLMEEDMGSALQYLQGKGLCLMPISLANAISTSTSMCQTTRNPINANSTTNNNPLLDGDLGVCPFNPPQSEA